jgi:hypothetical protein
MSEQAIILTKDMLEKIIVISSENAAKVAIDKVEKERTNDNQIKCCIIQNYY